MLGIAVGDHDGQPVALLNLQAGRHALTKNDLLFAGAETLPGIVLHILRQRAQVVFLLRIDALHLNRLQLRAAFNQPGEVDVRCSRSDAFHLLYLRQQLLPAGKGLIDRLDFAMRHHRQDTVIQLALETVHRAQTHDQYRHAQRNTDGGNHRDQRHHAATATPTAEPQAKKKRKIARHYAFPASNTSPLSWPSRISIWRLSRFARCKSWVTTRKAVP